MKKKLFSWISLLVFLAGLAVGSFLPAEPASAQADAAPLTLDTKTLYGKSFSSSVFKNYDLILVNYWAEWCGPCVGELPDLQKISQEYKNVLFIGAYVDRNNEAAIKTAEAAGVTFPLIQVDENPQLYDYLKMEGRDYYVPQTCFFDYTGKLISGPFVGGRSYMSWKSIIDDVLADAPKRPTLAKPKIKTQPKAQTVAAGKKVTFRVKASGKNLKYQWYYRKDSRSAWKKITSKGTSASYTFKVKASQNGWQYRCLVKNSAGKVYSKAVKLKVKK